MTTFCPKCNEPIKKTGTYDGETDTMRYPCSNKECEYVDVQETLANKKKRMLRLTTKDKMLIRGEIAYASEMPRRGRA
jgi:endogenous inhibitor of DNA gyrase (YacG/DUF329 family)